MRDTRGSWLRIAHSIDRPTITGSAPSENEWSYPSESE